MAAARQKVWVVEDSPLEAKQALQVLQTDFECELFVEGSSVLERISSGALPDLLVLDWELPGISGLEVCRFLRTGHDELALPILLVTSHRVSSHLAEGLAAGANDYVAKPYLPVELLARTKTLVRIGQQHRRGLKIEAERDALLTRVQTAFVEAERERQRHRSYHVPGRGIDA